MKVSVLSLKEKATQPWFTYFQIACKYKQSFMTNPLKINLTMLVYDYSKIGLSSVAYIFHKGSISIVRCGYEVQIKINFWFWAKAHL